MSIIIHFNTASFIPSSVKLPSAPSIISRAKTKLAMVPGIDRADSSVMTDDESSMVDIATSNTLYTHTVNDLKRSHVLGSCFGLPYQDHNYGAPPPPTPPSYSPPTSPAHANGVPEEETNVSVMPTISVKEETQDASITRCICGFEHDDEYMICCDQCLVWQHVVCMGLDRSNIPETYLCEKCQPRKVDRHKAKALQTRKKVTVTDSSETEDDIEVRNSEKKPRTRSKRRRKEETKPEKIDHKQGRRTRNFQKHKERIEAKRSKLRKTKNKESTSAADEEAQDAWEISLEWCDKNFETAITNQYTPEIQTLAKTIQLKGHERRFMELLLTRNCKVEGKDQKKLISNYDIPRDQPLIEYFGKFLLSSEFYELHPAFSKRLFPFVMFYSLDQVEICVDASVYGNSARFVRRSCKPNAELRHLVYNGNLHLYLASTKAVFKDDEITLPFNIKESVKDIDCACESEDCFLKLHQKNTNGDISHERKRRGRKLTFSADEDSSHSFVGTNGSPTKIKPVKSSSQTSDHTDGKSENEFEEHTSTGRKNKKTREERKIDAIMRAFDQMEKAAKRRQQAMQKHKSHPSKSEESSEKSDTAGTVKEEEKPSIASGSETQGAEEEKVPIPTPTKPKTRKRRRSSGSTLNRRRTRTNSGCDILSPEIKESLQLDCNSTASAANADNSNAEITTETLNVATSPISSNNSAATPTSPAVLKTKRSLLHEWLQEKSETNTNAQVTSPVTARAAPNSQCTTKYNPLSGCISAAHLRRSSTSAPIKTVPNKSCSEQGSAKKRWLRQAMHDCNPHEEPLTIDTSGIDGVHMENGCFSPTGHGELGSPGAADDTVTPLKKRRLMRESLESASSPLSPTAHNFENSCSALNTVSEETKTEQKSIDSDKDFLVDADTNSPDSVLSPAKPTEVKIIDSISESRDNVSGNKKEQTLSDGDSMSKQNVTLNVNTTLSACTEIKLSMQTNCDHKKMQITNDSDAQKVSESLVVSSKCDPDSMQLNSDKHMQSNSQTHQNIIPVKIQSTSNESTNLSSGVKRKIVFNDKCESSPISTSEDNVSESSILNKEVPVSIVETTSNSEIKQSFEVVEKELVNKILNNTISILTLNGKNTNDNDNSPKTPISNSMQHTSVSPIKNADKKVQCLKKEPTKSKVHATVKDLTSVINGESKSLYCNNSSVNSSSKKPGKLCELENKTTYMSSENSGSTKRINCASVAQKRKVSLSEYRKRMKEVVIKKPPAIEKISEELEIPQSISIATKSESMSEKLSLDPLPLFHSKVGLKSSTLPSSAKNSKKKKEPIVFEESDDDVIEHRENLTERLKREFGFDEDSGGCTITSTTNNFMSTGSSKPPPLPPPPPPPRQPRPSQNSSVVAPTPVPPPRFCYPVPTNYSRPSYIVPQVPSTQFIPVQQAVTAPGLPTIHPITPTGMQCGIQPPLLPTPHSYQPPLPRNVLRTSIQNEYSSVNAQSYTALVQPLPPPPPPKSYNHVYQPGLYK